ncbi:retrovirus-related pol polyprotein from transposon TNT 1-94 [Tanacetum coccineum]
MASKASHLPFDYITLLSNERVVTNKGLPKLKYVKDQLWSSCEMSKAKKVHSRQIQFPSSKGRLNVLHMDCVIHLDSFLHPRMNTKSFSKDFLTDDSSAIFKLKLFTDSYRTDRGTEFLNKTLHAYFKEEGIEHQTSTPRTPEQNGVVERRNHTLVEAARTMLSASKLPL